LYKLALRQQTKNPGEYMQKTALVVDNDFFFVEFLGELLEKKGYKVIKAYDGKGYRHAEN
jgi:CheY-like chemotaxis protein